MATLNPKKIPPFVQADDWFTVAQSDTVNFVNDTTNNTAAYPLACIYFGGSAAADIALVSPTGTLKTFKNVQPGTFMPALCKRVNDTGTTAADADMLALVGLNG